MEELTAFISGGGIVLNVTQCQAGSVDMGLYETSAGLLKAGVISGGDITTEAAVTKTMILLGSSLPADRVSSVLTRSLCGEMT
jgi:L-asparaginase